MKANILMTRLEDKAARPGRDLPQLVSNIPGMEKCDSIISFLAPHPFIEFWDRLHKPFWVIGTDHMPITTVPWLH